jgi:hypothetical protein
MKLSDLERFSDNPRKINEKNRQALLVSMRRFGYIDLIVWNERTGNIVGGHQRYDILVENGVEEVDVLVVDFDEDEEVAANLSLNNPAIEGEWDDPITELLERIQTVDSDFFEEANFDSLREAVGSMAPPELDDAEDKTKCPCCGYSWEVSDKDVKVLSADKQKQISDGGPEKEGDE